MKTLLAFIISTFLITVAYSRDFRPETHLENIPLADSSIQECVVFPTIAGVRYTVESSNDLVHWTKGDEIYSIGGEYVVTLREYTPAPPPPPGTPPASPPVPHRAASLRLQRATGPSGGTVVSWASLDHGGPVIVNIATTMDPGWVLIPIYWEHYGAYNFYICHPIEAVAPAAENSILGPEDSAMLAVLEASLPAMNQQVADSVTRARNTPAPGPSDPGSRRFLRVLVDPTVDTDLDGSQDWAEFEIAARGTGSLVAGVVGDAFDPDSNKDGVRDGNQLDADLDRTPDAKDPDASDDTAVFPLGPLPRYALFPITNAEPSVGFQSPFQINDKGTVLYDQGTWSGGIWTALERPDAGDPLVSAVAINDNDVVVGASTLKVRADPELFASVICFWGDPEAKPAFISKSTGGDEVFAVNSYDFAHGLLSPGSVLSNDGRFFADTWGFEDDRFKRLHNGYWKLPAGQTVATEETAAGGMFFNETADLKWGAKMVTDSSGNSSRSSPEKGLVYAPSLLPELPFLPTNVLGYPNSPLIALPKRDSEYQGMAWVNGSWQLSPAYAGAIDISSDGTAIGRTSTEFTAPIYLGGKWAGIERTLPVQTDVFDPSPQWHDGSVSLLDTTPGGWILARRGYPPYDHAVMLPIRAEGYYQQSNGDTITEAVGVDDFSIGSEVPGDEIQDRIWIMAPQGGINKIVKLKAPLNSNTPLQLYASNILFGTQDSISISNAVNPVSLRASDAVSSGGERLMTVALGSGGDEVSSVSTPIGLKIMKGRTVKVTVFQISRKLSATGTPIPPDADIIPTKMELENFLKDLYRPQINVIFDVTLKETPYSVQWDTNGNGTLDDNGPNTHSPDQLEITNAVTGDLTPSNIRVFIVSSQRALSSAVKAAGMTSRDQKTCWILGSKTMSTMSKQSVMETIGHEIGHIFVGYGHPNEKANLGIAPLPGTKHVQRLMCAGTSSSKDSRLLVKGEWDEAEKWLESEIDTPQP